MKDNDVIKALDILERFDFFGGQRAGRELWSEKPVDIQNEDIKRFSEDIAFLKGFINCQKAEIKQKDTEIDILIRKKETLKDELAELQRKNSELEIELKAMRGAANSYKSEVERLQVFPKAGFINLIGNCLVYSKNLKDYNDMRKGLKSEAIKEFAERLKEKAEKTTWISNGEFVVKDYEISREEFENLLEEMESERE